MSYELKKGLANIFINTIKSEYKYQNMMTLYSIKQVNIESFEDIRENFQRITKNFTLIDRIQTLINDIYAKGYIVNECVFQVYCDSLFCCIEGGDDMTDKLNNVIHILKNPVEHKIAIVQKITLK